MRSCLFEPSLRTGIIEGTKDGTHQVATYFQMNVLIIARMIAEDAALIRQGLMTHLAEQGGKKEDRGRVEVLPIQWRKHLDLDVRTPSYQVPWSKLPSSAKA